MLSGQVRPEELIAGLKANMRLDRFDEREIETVLDVVLAFPAGVREKILSLCHALSRVSSTLIPKTLHHIRRAAESLEPQELGDWIEKSFEILDSDGIHEFVSFMRRSGYRDLSEFRNPAFPSFREHGGVLDLYVKGISENVLSVAPDSEAYTDTASVYLPHGVSRFREYALNLTLYEFMAAHKWAEIRMGTILPQIGDEHEVSGLEALLASFPLPDLATDLFTILEAFLVDHYLWAELPGLMRKVGPVKESEFAGRPELAMLSGKTAFVEAIYHYYLSGGFRGRIEPVLESLLPELESLSRGEGRDHFPHVVSRFYAAAAVLPGEYAPERPYFLFGTIRPDRITERRAQEREERKRKLSEALRKASIAPLSAKLGSRFQGRRAVPDKDYVVLGGVAIETDQEMKEALLQLMPAAAVVKGREVSRDAVPVTLEQVLEDLSEKEERDEGRKYDEWDYRRGDYKRKWCTLFEVESATSEEPFVEGTLAKYRGVVKHLRSQFDALRPFPKMTRRNREGEMIDFDAAVDSYVNLSAGQTADENLYYRIERNTRDIAVLFLIDMSDSTKGWVNLAEKESLVLMCEALQQLGDKYAIAGFSGNTRFENLYYRIKQFSEPYSPEVKRRIAGIAPKDYTRMGPPLRHSINNLIKADARKKLLVVISDGKPQDIGEYSGDYAVEDTRMALIECKKKQIFPICVTLDRQAASYIPHMYGEVNYFVIDEARKLPWKLTEVYRKLTT